jgi:methylamine--corrinoid protein Co-methyltransferase
MENVDRLLVAIDRAYSGPIVEEKEFDLKVVAKGVARAVREHDIAFDKDHIIQQDDELIDRVFEAGLYFLEQSGIYHKDTQRLITFSRKEIAEALQESPDQVITGEGPDSRLMQNRQVEDPRPPQISGGPIGTPLSEDQYLPIMQSYWQEPIIDLVVPGCFSTIMGREIRSNSPLEIVASWQENRLGLEAARRAGRPGIPRMCVEMSISDVGHLSAISRGGFKPTDVHVVPMISEMKTNNELLNKIVHSHEQNGVILGFYNPILGGLGGGAEGVAVLLTAGMIAMQLVYMPASVESCPTHPFLSNSTHPDIMRAISVVSATLSRNTHLLTEFMTSPVSGPGTDSLLYECVAMATVASSCGASRVLGVRSAVGVVENHCTGLEARFNGEIAHAAAGLSRAAADEIVKKALAKYEPVMDKKPTGRPFAETYDPVTLRPAAAWQDTYDQVKDEIAGWGLPLK